MGFFHLVSAVDLLVVACFLFGVFASEVTLEGYSILGYDLEDLSSESQTLGDIEPSYPTKTSPNPLNPGLAPPSPTLSAVVHCGWWQTCPAEQICCCGIPIGFSCLQWNCCPHEGGICCLDHDHCCPHEFPICNLVTLECHQLGDNKTGVELMKHTPARVNWPAFRLWM